VQKEENKELECCMENLKRSKAKLPLCLRHCLQNKQVPSISGSAAGEMVPKALSAGLCCVVWNLLVAVRGS